MTTTILDCAADQIEAIRDAYCRQVEEILERTMRSELDRLHRHFPRRRIHFMDVAGRQILWLDDRSSDDLCYKLGTRTPTPLRELEALREWYIGASEGFCIQDIEILPLTPTSI